MDCDTDGRVPHYHHIRLFGLYTSIESRVAALFQECFEHLQDQVIVQASFGRLVDTHTGTPVNIPILTDALLPQSSTVSFDDNISHQAAEAVILNTLTQSRKCWNVQGNGEKTFIEFHYPQQSLVGITELDTSPHPAVLVPQSPTQRNVLTKRRRVQTDSPPSSHSGNLKYVQFCRLGKLTWFLPKSGIHVRFSCVSQLAMPNPFQSDGGSGSFTACKKRKVTCWDFHPYHNDGPSWALSLSQLDDAHPEFPYASRETDTRCHLYLRPHWPRQKPLDFQSYSSELKPVTQLLASQLLVHCRHIAQCLDAQLAKTVQTDGPSLQYFFPGYFGDIVSESRQHYDTKKVTSAAESDIEALRRLNNEVKRVLIEKYVVQNARVLDLACGHGQDVLKFIAQNVTQFVGIDLSKEEIKEAIHRVQKLQRQPTQNRVKKCSWNFSQGNVLEPETFQFLENTVFDTVSIQLAIHYCVSSEFVANQLLERISRHLKPGGYFIGSTADVQFITDQLTSALWSKDGLVPDAFGTWSPKDSYTLGNQYYHIRFSSDALKPLWTSDIVSSIAPVHDVMNSDQPHNNGCTFDKEQSSFKRLFAQKLRTTWGIKYNFWLKDHIDASEYIVPWDAFCALAAKHNLRKVEYTPFCRFLAHEELSNKRLRQWIRTVLVNIPKVDEELEAFQFYTVFAFIKDNALEVPCLPDFTSAPLLQSTCEPQQMSPLTSDHPPHTPEVDSCVQMSREVSVSTDAVDTVQCPESCAKPSNLQPPPVTNKKRVGSVPENQGERDDEDTWSVSSSSSSFSLSSSVSSSVSSSGSSESTTSETMRTCFKTNSVSTQ